MQLKHGGLCSAPCSGHSACEAISNEPARCVASSDVVDLENCEMPATCGADKRRCCVAVPIERVGKQLARHGADIASSTLNDWYGVVVGTNH